MGSCSCYQEDYQEPNACEYIIDKSEDYITRVKSWDPTTFKGDSYVVLAPEYLSSVADSIHNQIGENGIQELITGAKLQCWAGVNWHQRPWRKQTN